MQMLSSIQVDLKCKILIRFFIQIKVKKTKRIRIIWKFSINCTYTRKV